MDRALYIGMTGARQTLDAQTANSHNLANAGTVGFRAQLLASTPQPVAGDGLPTRVQTLAVEAGWDARSGATQSTGRALDVAFAPDVWLGVIAPDGSEAFTKAGDLQIDAYGQLRTGAGHAVLGEGGPMAVPALGNLLIGGDGTVSGVPQGSGGEALVAAGRLRTVIASPDQLRRGADGLMRPRADAEPLPATGTVLTAGALEGSNVSLPDAMINMIGLARQFEMQVKLMRSVEENAQASAALMRMGN